MTPEQSMRIYLAECALHAEMLEEGLRDANQEVPLLADKLADKTFSRVVSRERFERKPGIMTIACFIAVFKQDKSSVHSGPASERSE